MSSRIDKITRLIQDPAFIDFNELFQAQSFFNIVGRTHTETWHSAMLGWLLNTKSSHNLADYALRRFIMLMIDKTDPNHGKTNKKKLSLNDLIIDADFSTAVARPNEFDPHEVSIAALASKSDEQSIKGRIDVYVEGIRRKNSKVSILIEMKVSAPIDKKQAQKYVSFIFSQEKKWGVTVFPVFVTPQWNFYEGDQLREREILFGSGDWIVIDFQELYDSVIVPSLANPRLSNFGKIIIEEYVKTLRQPNPKKGNRRMVITEQERYFADRLQEKHGEAIDALIEILRPESYDELNGSIQTGGKKKPLKIELENGEAFEAKSIPELYRTILEFLIKSQYLENLELPYGTGRAYYLLTTDDPPTHASGKAFIRPVTVNGYSIEANKSRERGIYEISSLLEKLGLKTQTIEEA